MEQLAGICYPGLDRHMRGPEDVDSKPEAQARRNIDDQLNKCGWTVQDYKQADITASLGVAIREFQLQGGDAADYLLYADGKAIGVVEAKPEGHTLTGVETQSDKYNKGLPALLPSYRLPLPFAYETTGVENRFTNGLDPDVEPASELLKRILKERHRKWEEAELAKMIANGKPATNDKWKSRYREPSELDTNGLPQLPRSWVWTNLDTLTFDTIDYRGKTPPTTTDGIPTISAANVKDGRIVPGKKFVSSKTYEQWLVRGTPKPGDFVITTEAPVGEMTLFPAEGRFLLTRRVMACQTNRVVNSYLQTAMTGTAAAEHLTRHIRGTTVPRILKPSLLNTPIALPPLEEQEELGAEVERRMTLLSRIAETAQTQYLRSSGLRQSILMQAFEGKLVEQDPGDESASKLLARIKAEREKEQAKTNSKPKRRKRIRASRGGKRPDNSQGVSSRHKGRKNSRKSA